MKNLVLLFLVLALPLFSSTRPAMPMPSESVDIDKRYKCKVPDFLWQLPPMMESDYKECVNNKFMPSRKLAELVLKQNVNRKAELIDIKIVKEFYSRVYRISYKLDNTLHNMICNDGLSYCLEDRPIAKR